MVEVNPPKLTCQNYPHEWKHSQWYIQRAFKLPTNIFIHIKNRKKTSTTTGQGNNVRLHSIEVSLCLKF